MEYERGIIHFAQIDRHWFFQLEAVTINHDVGKCMIANQVPFPRRQKMSEINPEAPQPAPAVVKQNEDTKVAMAAVIAVAIIALACIVSCTIVTVAFLINAPWA